MSIANSRPKGIALKAAATVGVAAVLAMSSEPALAETQVDTDGTSTSQLQAVPDPNDKPPEGEFTDAAAVVNQYWTNHFTEYFGGSYTPPQLLPGTSVGVPGIYNSDVDRVPCGQEILPPNNAAYCALGNFIAADDKLLHNQDEVGDAFVWFVLAHEWGHAIQAQLQPQYLPNVPQIYELQADCFAGAALQGAANDGTLQWEAGDSQELSNALAILSDQSPWTDPESHGTKDQRVGSYYLGVGNGPLGCLTR
jgi:uncharacterized protein